MKKYILTIKREMNFFFDIEIEAENPKQAKEIIEAMQEEGEIDFNYDTAEGSILNEYILEGHKEVKE